MPRSDLMCPSTPGPCISEIDVIEQICCSPSSIVSKGKFNDRLVVIKEFIGEHKHASRSSEARYEAEKILLKIKHTNIVRILSCDDKKKIIVMDFFVHGDLIQYCEKHLSCEVMKGSNRAKNIYGVTIQVLGALKYLSSINVVHRNIKPENFFVGGEIRKPVIKLGDFESALRVSDNFILEDYSRFSPPYGPPELLFKMLNQSDKYPVSPYYDMYSFGIMLWVIFADRYPLGPGMDRPEFSKMIVSGSRLPYHSFLDKSFPEFPEALSLLITNCCKEAYDYDAHKKEWRLSAIENRRLTADDALKVFKENGPGLFESKGVSYQPISKCDKTQFLV